jgi:hypothetical protein
MTGRKTASASLFRHRSMSVKMDEQPTVRENETAGYATPHAVTTQ